MHQFCGNCGSPLGTDERCRKCGWTPLVQAKSAPDVKHRFCGNCGKPLGPDARCAVCGWTAPAAAVPGVPKAAAPVLDAVQQNNVSAKKNAAKKQSPKAVGISKKKKNILPVIIPIAVVLTGLIVVFALNFFGVIHLFGKNTAETLKRPSAEEYLSEVGDVSDKEPADEDDLFTEAEACREFSKRGFKDVEIVAYYNTDGEHIGTLTISPDSREKHPYYEALYKTPSNVVWTVVLMGDSFYAEPLSFKAGDVWDTPHMVSEMEDYRVYDGEANAFFTVEPDDDALELKLVDRIDAVTLNGLDAKGVDEL